MTRNGVPLPAGFRHFTEDCEVASQISLRCASHSPHKSSNIRALDHQVMKVRPDAIRSEENSHHFQSRDDGLQIPFICLRINARGIQTAMPKQISHIGECEGEPLLWRSEIFGLLRWMSLRASRKHLSDGLY